MVMHGVEPIVYPRRKKEERVRINDAFVMMMTTMMNMRKTINDANDNYFHRILKSISVHCIVQIRRCSRNIRRKNDANAHDYEQEKIRFFSFNKKKPIFQSPINLSFFLYLMTYSSNETKTISIYMYTISFFRDLIRMDLIFVARRAFEYCHWHLVCLIVSMSIDCRRY